MSFSRSFSDGVDNRHPGYVQQPQHHSFQQQQGSFSQPNNYGQSSSFGSYPNNFRSFGEMNGHGQHASAEPAPSQIYTAVYSSVAVYEMEVHNVAVMRRRSDGWLNATQILKVAGVEKGKRTKIIEKELLSGEHEKVQGGYGKYQGTWISYERGREFCRQYGVEELLRPLLDYDIGNDGTGNVKQNDTPTKEQAMAANRKRLFNSSMDNRVNGQLSGQPFFSNISPTASNALAAMTKAARFESPMPRPGSAQKRPASMLRRQSSQNQFSQESTHTSASQQSFNSDFGGATNGHPGSAHGMVSSQQSYGGSPEKFVDSREPPRKKFRPSTGPNEINHSVDPALQDETPTEANESFIPSQMLADADFGPVALRPLSPPKAKAEEEKRLALLDLFADHSRTDFTSHTAFLHLSGQDLDIPIDESGNSALHWAATLARGPLMRLLIEKGANIYRGNAGGQTSLMAAVLVKNSHDHSNFHEILEMLGPLIEFRDSTGRTVLHHIALTSGVKERGHSSRYYLETLLEFIVKQGSNSGQSTQLNSFDNGAEGSSKKKPISLVRFMSEVVNVQDKSGNTALNLAARIGNRVIIDQLDEVGADYNIPNNTGFRPNDFGIHPRAQRSQQYSGRTHLQPPDSQGQASNTDRPSSSGQPPSSSQIDQIRSEILATTTSILSQTQSHYNSELAKKSALVESQNAELRTIANRHKEVLERFEQLQQLSRERTERTQKLNNLRRIESEQQAKTDRAHKVKDQLGLVELEKTVLLDAASAPAAGADGELVVDSSQIQSLPPASVLRAHTSAYEQLNARLTARLHALESRSSQLEAQYRRIVSLCTGVDESQVESVLESLVAAIESEDSAGTGRFADGAQMGLERVREFLRKVEGVGAVGA